MTKRIKGKSLRIPTKDLVTEQEQFDRNWQEYLTVDRQIRLLESRKVGLRNDMLPYILKKGTHLKPYAPEDSILFYDGHKIQWQARINRQEAVALEYALKNDVQALIVQKPSLNVEKWKAMVAEGSLPKELVTEVERYSYSLQHWDMPRRKF